MKKGGTKTVMTDILKNRIIALLIDGYSAQNISRQLKINNVTVSAIKKECDKQINESKKTNQKKIIETTNEKIQKIAFELIDIAKRCQEKISDAKLEACSAPALATTMAIAIDKYNIIVGQATEIIHHTHATASKEELIALITGSRPATRPPAGECDR